MDILVHNEASFNILQLHHVKTDLQHALMFELAFKILKNKTNTISMRIWPA